jgi:hypothetical protein
MQDLKSSLSRLREMIKSHTDELPNEIRLLCQEIESIQRRLGTTDEKPEDASRVRHLVHDLSNFCTRLVLKEVG